MSLYLPIHAPNTKRILLQKVVIASIGLTLIFAVGCGQANKDLIRQDESSLSPVLAQITVSPSETTLTIGSTLQFTVKGYSSAETIMPISPTWDVTNGIGSINSSGLFMASSIGTGEIKAKIGSLVGDAIVKVTASQDSSNQNFQFPGGQSSQETSDSSKAKDETPPSPPKNLKATGYGNFVYLQWSKNLQEADFSKYKILRSLSKDGEFKDIGTSINTVYKDEIVEITTTYYYKVCAVDASSNESEFSNVAEVLNSNNNAPVPPTGLVVTGDDSLVVLSWDKNLEKDLLGYNVYRRDLKNYSYIKINNSILIDPSYKDTTVSNAHIYYYVVTAINASNKESAFSSEMSVTPLPPGVENKSPNVSLSIDPNAISPNGDGANDTLIINYDISDDFSKRANIQWFHISGYDQKRGKRFYKTVYEYTDNKEVDLPFSGTFIWDGVDDNGIKIENANDCDVYISVSDDTALITQKTSNTFVVDTAPPTLTNMSNAPKVLSPNGDGNYDEYSFYFSINDDNKSEAKIKIYNNASKLIKEITEINANGGFPTAVWDGKNNQGNIVSEGGYTYIIISTDKAGNVSNALTGTIEIDLTPPILSSIKADPQIFAPGRSFDGTSTISCESSEHTYYTLKIYDQEGNAFRTYSVDGGRTFSFVWDGSNGTGTHKPDYYTFNYDIKATDLAGNSTISSKYNVTTNRCPSYIPWAYADPDPFSTQNGGYTDIKYRLNYDNLKVSVVIPGSGQEILKTLVSEELKDRGEYSVKWYGDKDDGKKVIDQTYSYKITAYDPRDGVVETCQGTVVKDD